MNNETELKKFICPHCGADLKEVGVQGAQFKKIIFDCKIINDIGEIENERQISQIDEELKFYCNKCNQEIDIKKLGLTL